MHTHTQTHTHSDHVPLNLTLSARGQDTLMQALREAQG